MSRIWGPLTDTFQRLLRRLCETSSQATRAYVRPKFTSKIRQLSFHEQVEESDLTAVSNEIIMQDSGDHVLRVRLLLSVLTYAHALAKS